jgi:hypothetical protein
MGAKPWRTAESKTLRTSQCALAAVLPLLLLRAAAPGGRIGAAP